MSLGSRYFKRLSAQRMPEFEWETPSPAWNVSRVRGNRSGLPKRVPGLATEVAPLPVAKGTGVPSQVMPGCRRSGRLPSRRDQVSQPDRLPPRHVAGKEYESWRCRSPSPGPFVRNTSRTSVTRVGLVFLWLRKSASLKIITFPCGPRRRGCRAPCPSSPTSPG